MLMYLHIVCTHVLINHRQAIRCCAILVSRMS